MSLNLRNRERLPELMDDPSLDQESHARALAGLRRLNYFSRSTAILAPAIAQVCPTNGPVRVLDIATGGGDVAIGLARHFDNAGPSIEVSGCDISPVAVAEAQRLAASRGVSNVRFFQADAISGQLDGTYDVVMCSLFLHHLPTEQALALLRQMKRLATARVLVNDLRRTRLGYALAVVACRTLTRSPIVHVDGPLSVRAAFTVPEVYELAAAAGLDNANVTTHWPQRFLLDWATL